jgi:hypothetical protein
MGLATLTGGGAGGGGVSGGCGAAALSTSSTGRIMGRDVQGSASHRAARTIPKWITDEETTGIVHVRSPRWIVCRTLTVGE